VKTFEFESRLWHPRKREEVFPFFADAFNLEEITPPWLRFRLVSPTPVRMGVGTQIEYRLKVRGIPIRWRSRITVWDRPYRFVDEQLQGPYRMWVHEHLFSERAGETLCEDRVQYAVLGGSIVNKLFVESDVRDIFAHRSVRLQEIFQKTPVEEYPHIARLQMNAEKNPAAELQGL